MADTAEKVKQLIEFGIQAFLASRPTYQTLQSSLTAQKPVLEILGLIKEKSDNLEEIERQAFLQEQLDSYYQQQIHDDIAQTEDDRRQADEDRALSETIPRKQDTKRSLLHENNEEIRRLHAELNDLSALKESKIWGVSSINETIRAVEIRQRSVYQDLARTEPFLTIANEVSIHGSHHHHHHHHGHHHNHHHGHHHGDIHVDVTPVRMANPEHTRLQTKKLAIEDELRQLREARMSLKAEIASYACQISEKERALGVLSNMSLQYQQEIDALSRELEQTLPQRQAARLANAQAIAHRAKLRSVYEGIKTSEFLRISQREAAVRQCLSGELNRRLDVSLERNEHEREREREALNKQIERELYQEFLAVMRQPQGLLQLEEAEKQALANVIDYLDVYSAVCREQQEKQKVFDDEARRLEEMRGNLQNLETSLAELLRNIDELPKANQSLRDQNDQLTNESMSKSQSRNRWLLYGAGLACVSAATGLPDFFIGTTVIGMASFALPLFSVVAGVLLLGAVVCFIFSGFRHYQAKGLLDERQANEKRMGKNLDDIQSCQHESNDLLESKIPRLSAEIDSLEKEVESKLGELQQLALNASSLLNSACNEKPQLSSSSAAVLPQNAFLGNNPHSLFGAQPSAPPLTAFQQDDQEAGMGMGGRNG